MISQRPFDYHIIKTETCWLWRFRFGSPKATYAQWRVKGKSIQAHRFAWERVNGPIPKGKLLHHKCSNKLCVNPEHLELVSTREHYNKHLLHGPGKNLEKAPGRVGEKYIGKNKHLKPLREVPKSD